MPVPPKPFQNGVPSVGEPQLLTPQVINDEDSYRGTFELPIQPQPQAIIRLEGLTHSCGATPIPAPCESCGADWPMCLTCTATEPHLCFNCLEGPK